MGQQRNQQYNKRNNRNEHRVDPEREARIQEAVNRKQADLDIIDHVCHYLNDRINEIADIITHGGDISPRDYALNTKDIIEYFNKIGVNVEDTKRISQFTAILSDLAKAQLDRRLDDINIFIRFIYVDERIFTFLNGRNCAHLVKQFNDMKQEYVSLFYHTDYIIANTTATAHEEIADDIVSEEVVVEEA